MASAPTHMGTSIQAESNYSSVQQTRPTPQLPIFFNPVSLLPRDHKLPTGNPMPKPASRKREIQIQTEGKSHTHTLQSHQICSHHHPRFRERSVPPFGIVWDRLCSRGSPDMPRNNTSPIPSAKSELLGISSSSNLGASKCGGASSFCTVLSYPLPNKGF